MGLKPDYVSKLLETKPKKLGDEEQTIRRRLKNRLVTAIQKRRRGAAVSAFAEQVRSFASFALPFVLPCPALPCRLPCRCCVLLCCPPLPPPLTKLCFPLPLLCIR